MRRERERETTERTERRKRDEREEKDVISVSALPVPCEYRFQNSWFHVGETLKNEK